MNRALVLDWIQTLRIKHWVKNGIIFAAIIFSKNIFNPHMLFVSFAAFILFGFSASSIYLLNDIMDIEKDKHHPYKSKKAVPAGRIMPGAAFAASILLAALGITGGFFLEFRFGAVLCVYCAINILYSLYLKNTVILDVFCVAGGFVLRVVGGALAISVEISNWLLICTGLLALFLSFAKRRHELVIMGEDPERHRRILSEYTPYFLDQMTGIVTSATVVAYMLYTVSAETISKFGTDKLILTTPFVLYGIFRYLYLIHRRQKGGNPARLLLTDIPVLLDIMLWVAASVIIIYM